MKGAMAMQKENVRWLNVAFVASGGGTTFERGAKACLDGEVQCVHPKLLICTEEGAQCKERAERLGVICKVVDFKKCGDDYGFNWAVSEYLKDFGIDFVITAGCKRRIIMKENLSHIRVYNTHPADPKKHGGWHMHGVEVHRHVILEIIDQLWRSMIKTGDAISTVVTFHEMLDREYDQGPPLLQISVPIPWRIIRKIIGGLMIGQIATIIRDGGYQEKIESAAKELQQHVLEFEYRMLPAAINLAAHIVRLDREGMK
jgi:folate-dependent phosphoribosylglycinamide formyltransferase PurN